MTRQITRIDRGIKGVEAAVGKVPLEMAMTVSRVCVGSVGVDSE